MAERSLATSDGAFNSTLPSCPVVPAAENSGERPPASSLLGGVKTRGRGPLLWSIGGTVLSALGFIGLALFEQYNGMLTEMRSDLKHFNEVSADFVKKESFQRFRDQVKGRFKDAEDANTARAQIALELRASEKARQELARELQRLHERIAFLEGRQLASPGIASSGPAKN